MSVIVNRRPNPDEATTVCAFVRHAISTAFPTFPPEAVDAYLDPWTPEGVKSRLKEGNDVLIVALTENQIIALTSGTAPEGGVGTVIWLFVDARWRGRKVGRGLYEAACNAYRELGGHKMKLTAPSEETKRFYEGCGMRVEGFHPCHWYKRPYFSLGVIL